LGTGKWWYLGCPVEVSAHGDHEYLGVIQFELKRFFDWIKLIYIEETICDYDDSTECSRIESRTVRMEQKRLMNWKLRQAQTQAQGNQKLLFSLCLRLWLCRSLSSGDIHDISTS
jgi:hypothetical protein